MTRHLAQGMKNFWKSLDQRDARTRAMVHHLQEERYHAGIGTRYQSERAAQVWSNLGKRPAKDMRMAYQSALAPHPHPHMLHAHPQPITYNGRGSRAAVKHFYNNLVSTGFSRRARCALPALDTVLDGIRRTTTRATAPRWLARDTWTKRCCTTSGSASSARTWWTARRSPTSGRSRSTRTSQRVRSAQPPLLFQLFVCALRSLSFVF